MKPLKSILSISMLLLILFLATQPESPALALSSGPNFPTVAISYSAAGSGNVDWLTPEGIRADDTSYAHVNLKEGEVSQYLSGTGFGFSLPAEATITGIVVDVERYSNDSNIQDYVVQLTYNGEIIGNNYAVTGVNWPKNSEAVTTYAPADPLWGTTLTGQQISSSTFGVVFAVTNAGTRNMAAFVNDITVTVSYMVATSLTVTPLTDTYGNTVDLSATLSPAVSGLNIDFTLAGETGTVCSASTDGSGVATCSTDLLTDVGTYPGGVVASFTGNSDYMASSGSADLTVNPREASVTPEAASKTYGDADPDLTGTLAGFLEEDNVTATYSRVAGETVTGGPYIISASLSPEEALSNYDITYNEADFTIEPKAASVAPEDASKTYGDADPDLTGTLEGFLEEDNVTATYSRVAGETVTGGPYTISASLSPEEAISNYDITYNEAEFTIEPKAASVTPEDASKTYGNADPTLTGTLAGFLEADNVTATYSRVAGETVTGGPYTISASLGPLDVLSNYDITYNTGVLTITPRLITVTADAQTKQVGQPDPELTYKITSGSLAFSDKFSGALSREAGEAVGNYAILQGSLALNVDYDLTFIGADLTITNVFYYLPFFVR